LKKTLFFLLAYITFSFLLAQITTFPFTETFSSTSTPEGWQNNGWGFNGTNASTSTYNQMLITPQLQLPPDSPNQTAFFSFWIKSDGGLTYCEVLISTNSTSYAVEYEDNVNTVLKKITLPLSGYSGQTISIGFRRVGGSTLVLDDVWVGLEETNITFPWQETFNTAGTPSGWTNFNNRWLFGSGFTYTSGQNQMLITPRLPLPTTSAERSFFLLYGIKGRGIDVSLDYQILISSTGISTTNFTVELTESILFTGSNYDFQYRTINLSSYQGQNIYIAFQRVGGNSSNISLDDVWVGEDEAQTTIITEFPWVETFNNSFWQKSGGWTFGSGVVYTSNNNQMLLTPKLLLPTAPAGQAFFFTYMLLSIEANYQVLVSTTDINPANFTAIFNDIVTDSAWQNRSLNLESFQGQEIYLAIQKSSGENLITIDNVRIGLPDPPQNLTATPLSNRVHLTWQEPPSGTQLGFKVYRDATAISNTITTITFLDNNVVNDIEYTYYVAAVYEGGIEAPTEPVAVVPGVYADTDEVIKPLTTTLKGNYPNPFNPSTILQFSLAKTEMVSIDIYNIHGQLVRSLVKGLYSVGEHSVLWNGLDENVGEVSSGVYFYRMVAGEYAGVGKMVMVK